MSLLESSRTVYTPSFLLYLGVIGGLHVKRIDPQFQVVGKISTDCQTTGTSQELFLVLNVESLTQLTCNSALTCKPPDHYLLERS